MIDLTAAAAEVARLARAVRDNDLDGPTPCAGTSVAALLDHLLGLTLAFRDAARKTTDGANTGPAGIAPTTELPADWRERLSRQLDDLVAAWDNPAAWEGQTVAGGVTLPAAQMGVVALDELVLHGWDLARAIDQPFHVTPADAEAVLAFTTAVAEQGAPARDGLFGPPVAVAAEAPPFERALGLAGRDPAWRTAPSRLGSVDQDRRSGPA